MFVIVLLLASLHLINPTAQTADTVPLEDVRELARGNTDFAVELYGRVAGGMEGQNVFLSPFSVSSALAMAYAGAREETEEQMAEVLHFTLPQDRLHPAFGLLGEQLSTAELAPSETGDPLILNIANGLWVDSNFPLLQGYVGLVREHYDAEVRNMDFVGDPDGSRRIINEWASRKTRRRIQNLIPGGVIDVDTRVVLTNAIYFKGSWQHPFPEEQTEPDDFHLPDGSEVEVPMMHLTESLPYTETAGCAAVELPYVGGNHSMIMLLPDGSPADFEKSLDTDTLRRIVERLNSYRVTLTMPRFEFSCGTRLAETLGAMGMSLPFSMRADFSGFTGQPDLCISEVVHKALVKVDESGTEAAAATAVVMEIVSMPPPELEVEMTLDRPFLFLILDKSTLTVEFMGRVCDPSA
ncbi:serpin family protein [Candidatus Fermentibacteria bacterium]|nr:serpin family protein [Candidatus Fermentibacteria bacterium]